MLLFTLRDPAPGTITLDVLGHLESFGMRYELIIRTHVDMKRYDIPRSVASKFVHRSRSAHALVIRCAPGGYNVPA